MLALTHFLPFLPLFRCQLLRALLLSSLSTPTIALLFHLISHYRALFANALGRAALQHCFVVPPPLVATSLAPILHVISFIYCSAGICWPFCFFLLPA